ncbi:MAG TPA: class I SAM-dependent methyltransferase [Acidimicrobiales bacterium]|nr:class I SAM-dependent methyltransferase [Acidimicrobiales bacterium]
MAGVADFDGRAYQARFDALAAAGRDVHGEANFVMRFAPRDVLDAGCGTGRVAIELSRRGVDVVGVDVSASMIGEARRLAPQLQWIVADLTELDLARKFEVVVMAGNVPLFCAPQRRHSLVTHCAEHVGEVGRLVAGFQLGKGFSLGDYDRACEEAGLELEARYATWDGDIAGSGAD